MHQKAKSPCASARASRKTPKAPSAHRALPGPGVYRFGFSRKAGALTRKRKATQRAAFPPNLAPALMSLSSRRTALLPPPLTEPYMRFSRIRLFRRSQVESICSRRHAGKERTSSTNS